MLLYSSEVQNSALEKVFLPDLLFCQFITLPQSFL